MSDPRTYTITDMAKQFGLTLRTLRFYEQRGIMAPARSGMTRLYSESERLKLANVVRWRSQGFTITEIKGALRNGGFPKEKLVAQVQHLRRQRAEIDKALAELSQVAA